MLIIKFSALVLLFLGWLSANSGQFHDLHTFCESWKVLAPVEKGIMLPFWILFSFLISGSPHCLEVGH